MDTISESAILEPLLCFVTHVALNAKGRKQQMLNPVNEILNHQWEMHKDQVIKSKIYETVLLSLAAKKSMSGLKLILGNAQFRNAGFNLNSAFIVIKCRDSQ